MNLQQLNKEHRLKSTEHRPKHLFVYLKVYFVVHIIFIVHVLKSQQILNWKSCKLKKKTFDISKPILNKLWVIKLNEVGFKVGLFFLNKLYNNYIRTK